MFEVKYNLLNKEELDFLKNIFLKEPLWIFNQEQAGENDGCFFSHPFFKPTGVMSHHIHLLNPIINFLNPISIINIRANLLVKRSKPQYSIFHCDHMNNTKVNHKTSIFYLNTNNGYTEFKDGSKCMSEENKLITFNADQEHRAVSQTDQNYRIVINFNYFN
jgi:hypothetical protein